MGRSISDEKITNIVKLKNNEFENEMKKYFHEFRNKRIDSIGKETNLELERRVFLQTIDFLWRSHLQYLEHLRLTVGLRGYAQKDPLEEFKREAFKLFEDLVYLSLISTIDEDSSLLSKYIRSITSNNSEFLTVARSATSPSIS